jgi:metal-responsive CopG/Arc/MetJ family transcriptional regulator
MERKTISLPEELADYVDENHINLSRFVQDKLRDQVDAEDLSEEEAREIGQKLKDLGYLDK